MQRRYIIRLLRDGFVEGVEPEGLYSWVLNECAFQVEPPVRHKYDFPFTLSTHLALTRFFASPPLTHSCGRVALGFNPLRGLAATAVLTPRRSTGAARHAVAPSFLVGLELSVVQHRRRASQHLPRQQRRHLRHHDLAPEVPALVDDCRRLAQHVGVLDCAHQEESVVRVEHLGDHLGEVAGREADFDEHVQALHDHVGHGHEARVPVVYHQIAPNRLRSDVVDAAGSVRHVCHDDDFLQRFAKELEYVRDFATPGQQPLWHLQRHPFCVQLSHFGDALCDFEVVVGRQCLLCDLVHVVGLTLRVSATVCGTLRRC
ncbi:uncharacterized protein BcabD6B2_00940 [Babesia caballi]|uniref:Uncharacterized protein n=1 Tax=Babesia caballi TaxID=5871 RepID=A0AAV4LP53_BABCB|nr:hypothetical protein BcabD6B2_00940 [Babesia caballi]